MLQIDGSYGEGGGQIVRTAVALSVSTKTPVEITNIRARRPEPGLKAQHHTAISCMKALCNAKTEGLQIGSSTVRFTPGEVKSGNYRFDIGTAGSMILVFQPCILCAVHATKPVTITLTGGTDVKWAPSWDYFTNVFLPLLKKMGVSIDFQLRRRGYYPKGGGEASVTIHPCDNIKPLNLDRTEEFGHVDGNIHIAGLPDHISKRMKHAVLRTFMKTNIEPRITIEKMESISPGTGITLWAISDNTILGAAVPGERGVSSEKIGETTADYLIKEIESGATLDIHVIDQLLAFMASVKNRSSSCRVQQLSNHVQTTLWLLQQFFNFSWKKQEDDKIIRLTVTPK